MQKLKIEQRKVKELIPYSNNAKIHKEEQITVIADSIKEFGFNNPILLDGENGVIAGHGRLLAAKRLELKEVPTIELSHLSEVQKRAYILADNRTGEVHTGWDFDLLSFELTELKEVEFDIELTGFDDGFLILDEVEGLTDPDAVPDVPETPVTKLGDIWLCGNHRVMCGDSTSIDAVDKLMDGKLADQLITDPPYNVAYEGKTKDALKIENDSMNNEDFRQFLSDAFKCADAVMKEGAVFYIWHADSEGYNFRGACFDVDWQVRQCLIWNKNSMVMGRQDYHWKHEPCLYGWKSGAGHLWNTDRKQVTVLDFSRPTKNIEHPTMKPVDLIEYQILNNTKGQDVVLDLFGGGGSTLIASEKNHRINNSMELDPKYCDVIVKRWQEFTGHEAILESTGEAFNAMAESNE